MGIVAGCGAHRDVSGKGMVGTVPDSKRAWIVRPKDNLSTAIALFSSTGDIVTEEICHECYLRGVVWHLHDASEEHKGSDAFKQKWRKESL